jgi:hypothetical protein
MSPEYAAISLRAGVPYLRSRLAEVFVAHIKKTLPMTRSRITSILFQKTKELATLNISDKVGEQQSLILSILAKYCK